eukprot:GAFH01005531.1.p2 GENE.GAFH01005531.1~~GAFH01005531.1.p2  ORF type:complete len:100 (-),score=5.39 GAFH01005531.1:275-574(-)
MNRARAVQRRQEGDVVKTGGDLGQDGRHALPGNVDFVGHFQDAINEKLAVVDGEHVGHRKEAPLEFQKLGSEADVRRYDLSAFFHKVICLLEGPRAPSH